MGRPSDYNEEIADAICEHMVCGQDDKPESLRAICRTEGMPALGTIMRWLTRYPEFQEQYALARKAQAEVQQEEIIEISDNCTDDVTILISADGERKEAINHSAIARAKLQIDTRKWLMGKMQPKKYGDSTTIKGDPEAPLAPSALTLSVTPDLVKSIVQQVRDEF